MEENKLAIQNEFINEDIKNLIYTIRNKQVMLDSDVAMLYHYETKKVNQAVKRNIDRFPERFCFKLTKNEFEVLRSQIVTSKLENYDKKEKRGGRRDLPYVFTEQGIAMLSGLLKNDILKMLAKKKNNVEAVILTSDKSNINVLDIKKFNKEYPVLKVTKTNKFHDRFILIDNKEMYHLGASIKDLGKKCFGINKIEDMKIIEKIVNIGLF